MSTLSPSRILVVAIALLTSTLRGAPHVRSPGERVTSPVRVDGGGSQSLEAQYGPGRTVKAGSPGYMGLPALAIVAGCELNCPEAREALLHATYLHLRWLMACLTIVIFVATPRSADAQVLKRLQDTAV